jgi:hypothetical protein
VGQWPTAAAVALSTDPAVQAEVLPFTVNSAAVWEREGRARLEALLRRRVETHLTGHSSTGAVEGVEVSFSHGIPRAVPMLLPVWVASYRDGDTVHTFVINAVDGAIAGELPTSLPTVGTRFTCCCVFRSLTARAGFAALVVALTGASLVYALTHPITDTHAAAGPK